MKLFGQISWMINHTHRNENKRLSERRRQWCGSHGRLIQMFESSTFCEKQVARTNVALANIKYAFCRFANKCY